jgi:uncharacterized protein
MKDTLLYLVKELVSHPDDVTVDEEKDNERTIFIIHTHAEDIGKIIGKNGRIIRALRDLIKLIAAKHDLYVDIEIAEDK